MQLLQDDCIDAVVEHILPVELVVAADEIPGVLDFTQRQEMRCQRIQFIVSQIKQSPGLDDKQIVPYHLMHRKRKLDGRAARTRSELELSVGPGRADATQINGVLLTTVVYVQPVEVQEVPSAYGGNRSDELDKILEHFFLSREATELELVSLGDIFEALVLDVLLRIFINLLLNPVLV